MTRIGVVSDSHRMPRAGLEQAANELRARHIDRLIHLGDGTKDAEALSSLCGVPLWAVAGNCDDAADRALEEVRLVDGAKLLICHGHRFSVKLSLIRLRLRAEEVGARVALYGHTHGQVAEWDGGILLLNPGALMDGKCAILTIDDGALRYDFMPRDARATL